jgi:ABC-2 type transport system ATP-binding protein
MEKAIEVEHLKKYFKKVKAVDDISFYVEKGDLFAFLGPNGAGKSTTIRVLTTLAAPTSGKIKIGGYDVVKESKKVRSKIGLVSDKLILYNKLTVMENIFFFSNLYGLKKSLIYERAERLLKILDIWDFRNRLIDKLSTGMKQKVNIARALIPEPEILFLDEPTLGLDPFTTKKIRNFIAELNQKGKTIILTTHILHEVELLANKVAIINKGKIITIDTPRNLKALFKEKEIVEIETKKKEDVKKISGNVIESVENYLKIEVDNLDSLIDEIREKKIEIKSIRTYEPSLEDIFIKVTNQEVEK